MEGFADVPQTRIQVYYPKNGVSAVQEHQMVTQEGENVDVCAVIGNFDDAQSGVKRIFSDEAIRAELDRAGISSCPPPTPSTGAVFCLRWSTTSPLTAIWCGMARHCHG